MLNQERGLGGSTFITKKRIRMTKTLTRGCSQAEERPRPGGGGVPQILVQVKLSKRELIHSLGINCCGKYGVNAASTKQ